eukprot:GHVU01055029.1.p1 GENE.GHVU01055029.1~~GHVU01055029.1.p1  ORF type:complete len:100 (+),score=11.87 GHVU01055029.1:246-545(+)
MVERCRKVTRKGRWKERESKSALFKVVSTMLYANHKHTARESRRGTELVNLLQHKRQSLQTPGNADDDDDGVIHIGSHRMPHPSALHTPPLSVCLSVCA